uniref:Uncharacterized protein n=1 Tax=Knipowitschia caucasica TaxID=637954 RepID=A0AAV2LH96_KNICA
MQSGHSLWVEIGHFFSEKHNAVLTKIETGFSLREKWVTEQYILPCNVRYQEVNFDLTVVNIDWNFGFTQHRNITSNSILLPLGSVTIGHSHFSLNIVPENMQRLTSLAYSLPQFHCNRCRMIGGRAVRALQLL